MILVDSTVWIDFLRGADSPHRRLLSRLIEEDEQVSITEMILTEVLQGIKNDSDFRKTRDRLLAFPIHRPKGVETYLAAAQIYRDCRKRGKTLRKTVDCVIAAICIENDLVLLHKDADFDRIEECSALKCYKLK